MLKGTIIENSLSDKSILGKLKILETREVGDWVLHDVLVEEAEAPELAKYLSTGPWYIHLWTSGEDEFVVLFKDRMFRVKQSDKSTWQDAIAYGKSIGIPQEQLDFPID